MEINYHDNNTWHSYYFLIGVANLLWTICLPLQDTFCIDRPCWLWKGRVNDIVCKQWLYNRGNYPYCAI